jgi:hypothetical protein
MAQISRCAVASLCPTDAQIDDAIFLNIGQEAHAWADAQRAANPKYLIIADVIAITQVGNVHCGARSVDEPRAVQCSFTYLQGRHIVFEVAKLTWDGQVWIIADKMAVSRLARPRPRKG